METQRVGSGAGPIDAGLEETRQRFSEAFNRQDARAVAEFWAEDGTLIDPGGAWAEGRDAVERLYGDNARTFLQGTTSRFTITSVRRLGDDLAFLDLDHDLENFRMQDGTRQPMRLHVVILARRHGPRWQWIDVRPHAHLPPPPALH